MPRPSRKTILSYGGAVLAVFLATGARWALNPLVQDRQPFAMFYLAVTIVALYGGLGPGLLATALSLVSASYFFITPRLQWSVSQANSYTGIVIFLGNMLVVSLLAQGRTNARQRQNLDQEQLLREMTERQRIEAELRESEVRIRAFIDNSPAIHVIKDEQGRYTYANSAWTSKLHRPVEAVMGADDFALFPEAVAQAFRENDLKVMDSGEAIEVMESVDDKHWMSLKFPIESGGRRYLGGIYLDVTDRVEALQALKRSEDLFRALADSMPQIVWAARPDGIHDYYNKRWFDYTGLTVEETFSQAGWNPILHPDDVGRCWETWDASVKSGEPYELEYRFKDRHQGGYRWHLGRALPVRDDDGNIVRWYGTCTDIDDQKRAEETAEAANFAKDRFLAILSHELRTPLTPIMLAVASMIDSPETDADARPMLEMVRRNVALEARLIDDLLDLTRINQGKMTFDPAPTDAHAQIRHALEICLADIESARITVSLECAARDHTVMVDPARLQQVFWNLIKNAVKFTPPQGRLAIRTSNARSAEGQSRLVVEVQDSGIGITPEVLPRVFAPFEQGEASYRTRKYGGLGLGLAISRSVVEAHGGTLTATSEGTGRGSTFRIELAPIAGPIERPRLVPASGLRGIPGLHILLVEDDPSTRQVLARVLKKYGHEVTTADSVSSAILAAEGQVGRLNLILSDIGLPDGSGLDVVRLLKPLLAIPAIALTGFGTEDDIRKGVEAGFTAHLIKPIEPHVLEATIRQVAASVA